MGFRLTVGDADIRKNTFRPLQPAFNAVVPVAGCGGAPVAALAAKATTADPSEQAARKYTAISKLWVRSRIQPTMKGPT